MSSSLSGSPAAAAGSERSANEHARHWDSLDALRGIAAFLVLTFHCSQVSTGFGARNNPLSLAAWAEPWSWVKFTPLRLFVSSGPPAVVLFFALSGFVLSLPFLRSGSAQGYWQFAIKRFCRIYPPFAAAILISAALYALVQPAPIASLSPWFNEVLWDRPLSADYITRNLLMTGLRPDMTLDLVMWSLVHELRISLIFPILFVLTRRWPVGMMLASVVLAIASTAWLGGGEPSNLVTSLVDTCRFIFLFVGGIIIAGNAGQIARLLAHVSGKTLVVGWIVAVGLMMAPGQSLSIYYNFIWGAGGLLLLVLTVGSVRAQSMLSASPLVWLGRISYSLYLIHVPLLLATVHLLNGRAPVWLAIVLVIPLALGVAELLYRCVERPSIRVGRRLTAPTKRMLLPITLTPSRSSR